MAGAHRVGEGQGDGAPGQREGARERAVPHAVGRHADGCVGGLVVAFEQREEVLRRVRPLHVVDVAGVGRGREPAHRGIEGEGRRSPVDGGVLQPRGRLVVVDGDDVGGGDALCLMVRGDDHRLGGFVVRVVDDGEGGGDPGSAGSEDEGVRGVAAEIAVVAHVEVHPVHGARGAPVGGGRRAREVEADGLVGGPGDAAAVDRHAPGPPVLFHRGRGPLGRRVSHAPVGHRGVDDGGHGGVLVREVDGGVEVVVGDPYSKLFVALDARVGERPHALHQAALARFELDDLGEVCVVAAGEGRRHLHGADDHREREGHFVVDGQDVVV